MRNPKNLNENLRRLPDGSSVAGNELAVSQNSIPGTDVLLGKIKIRHLEAEF